MGTLTYIFVRPAEASRKKYKKRRPVSRVLFCILPLIWDGCRHPPLAAYPLQGWIPEEPFGSGQLPSPKGPAVYLALQPMRCTAASVTTGTGGLLPRLFTLIPTPRGRNGYFLLHSLRAFTRLPVRKHGALCCPDFPPLLRRGGSTVCARQRY